MRDHCHFLIIFASLVATTVGCSKKLARPPLKRGPKATMQYVPTRSSDFVALLPAGITKRKFIVGCTACHQAGPPYAYRKTKVEWQVMIAWMKKIDDELELKLIPFKNGELADWLTAHAKLPPRESKVKLEKATVTEFPLGIHTGFYHDVAWAGGWVWTADYFGNVLYGINPKTGARVSYPIPITVKKGKPAGAHAIDTTRDGMLWITFTKSEQVARFDPKTRKFRIYSGFPKGGNVQYFALDVDRYVYQDKTGGIWVNHFSREILSRLDPKTGAITSFKTPRTKWLPEKGVHLYAVVADSRGRLWYTETHGNRLGVLDPATGKAEEWALFVDWSGPKRLAIDKNDVLWIPHLGTGKITIYDTRQRKKLAQLQLPIRGDYPYSVRRNRYDGSLWVTGSGSDCLYRLDPTTRRFEIFRLPRRGAYARTIDFRPDGSVWTAYSSFPNKHTRMPHKTGVVVRLVPQRRLLTSPPGKIPPSASRPTPK